MLFPLIKDHCIQLILFFTPLSLLAFFELCLIHHKHECVTFNPLLNWFEFYLIRFTCSYADKKIYFLFPS